MTDIPAAAVAAPPEWSSAAARSALKHTQHWAQRCRGQRSHQILKLLISVQVISWNTVSNCPSVSHQSHPHRVPSSFLARAFGNKTGNISQIKHELKSYQTFLNYLRILIRDLTYVFFLRWFESWPRNLWSKLHICRHIFTNTSNCGRLLNDLRRTSQPVSDPGILLESGFHLLRIIFSVGESKKFLPSQLSCFPPGFTPPSDPDLVTSGYESNVQDLKIHTWGSLTPQTPN